MMNQSWILVVATVVIIILGAGYVRAMDKEKATTALTETPPEPYQEATFAAGCFWCVESEFQAIEGVKEVISGYTGGHVENPSYQQVTGKKTGHAEAVRVVYDPNMVGYERLLEAFWLIHDPTQADGQGVDLGPQYRSAIFYHSEAQKEAAEASKMTAQTKFKDSIVTEITPASSFYVAEGYHQNYYENKGIVYQSVFDLEGKSTTMRKRKWWQLF